MVKLSTLIRAAHFEFIAIELLFSWPDHYLYFVRLHLCMWQPGHGKRIVYRWSIVFLISCFSRTMLALFEQPFPQFTKYVSAWLQETKKGSVNLDANRFCIHQGTCVVAISLQSWNWKTLPDLSQRFFYCIPVFRRFVAGTVRGCTRRAKSISAFETAMFRSELCCADPPCHLCFDVQIWMLHVFISDISLHFRHGVRRQDRVGALVWQDWKKIGRTAIGISTIYPALARHLARRQVLGRTATSCWWLQHSKSWEGGSVSAVAG